MRTRTTRTLIVLFAGAMLLTGCTWGRNPSTAASGAKLPPRDQPNAAALSVDLQSMRNENEALRARQHENEKELAKLTNTFEKMQREQRAFREAMATNFDLLEQSVALTLSKTVTADLAAPAPVQTAPAAMSPAPVAMTPASKPVISTTPAVMRRAPSAGQSAPMAIAPTHVRPVAAVATPQAARPMARDDGDDPDLTPPANPRKLIAHRPAKALYEKGFALFAKRQFDQSIIVFQNFLNRYPDDIYSDNAQFWIGESLMRMKRVDDAEQAYRAVLREFEHRSTLEGFKTPDAIYRIGQTYELRGEPHRARYYFQALAERYPESSAGRKAKRDLASIGLKTASN